MVPRPVYYAMLLIQVGCLALIGAKAQTQSKFSLISYK